MAACHRGDPSQNDGRRPARVDALAEQLVELRQGNPDALRLIVGQVYLDLHQVGRLVLQVGGFQGMGAEPDGLVDCRMRQDDEGRVLAVVVDRLTCEVADVVDYLGRGGLLALQG